jgi:hypothetical protein
MQFFIFNSFPMPINFFGVLILNEEKIFKLKAGVTRLVTSNRGKFKTILLWLRLDLFLILRHSFQLA